jgi:hypothetical protein
MKLLTATREGQGDRDGDFCHAVEGELVFAGFVCASDRSDPAGGCGCGRSFSGLNSLRATTTALVRELELTYDDVRLALSAHLVAAGMGPDVMDAEDFDDMLEEEVEQTIRYASVWEPGSIVGRRLDSVHLRTPAVR